jgi:hypothetical protein
MTLDVGNLSFSRSIDASLCPGFCTMAMHSVNKYAMSQVVTWINWLLEHVGFSKMISRLEALRLSHGCLDIVSKEGSGGL